MSLFLHVDPILASVVTDITKGIVFTLFVISAVVLSVVILLQEGKGGGLGSAFGGAAADAFGVKSGTVNKFTSYLAAAFLGLALLYSALNARGDRISTDLDEGTVPAEGLLEPVDGTLPDGTLVEDAAGGETPPVVVPPEDAPGDGN